LRAEPGAIHAPALDRAASEDNVPVYCVTPKTGRVKTAALRSPRVMIVTDADRVESIPQSVRFAADVVSTEDLSAFEAAPPEGADGFIAWLDGDELLQGGPEDLRAVFLSGSSANLFLPVHLPCLAEADFVSLQPRLLFSHESTEAVSTACRIKAVFTTSTLARSFWAKSRKSWAQLHAALLREQVPGGGIEPLKQLWQTLKSTSVLRGLVLRNLILALLRATKVEKAAELLALGTNAYPEYSDLYYLSAVLWLYRQKPSKAVADLERAMQLAESAYIGSGGETSYRASWLLGTIHEEIGEEQRAASCFLPGILRRPAFVPSVSAILRQRFSRFRAEQLSSPLCELVRREPVYLDAVFDFFLRHRAFDAPRRLLATLPLAVEARDGLQARLSAADVRPRSRSNEPAAKPGIIVEGPFLTISGHARVNRVLGRSFLDSACFDAALEPSEAGSGKARLLPDRARILEGLRRCPPRVDLTIRHFWPPDFRRPEMGRLASMVPWEHRAIPRVWVREIERGVDELWVPSSFVATAFIQAGVSAERVQVIPHGFDPAVFNPRVKPCRPAGCRRCMFLFVGGTIRRKGIDLLLQAYADAFSPHDDVTLVIKDTGSSGFYQHNNYLQQIREMCRRSNAPHVLLLTEEFDDARLAMLYRGCDVLVLPYRGEGFGMPLIEAMACGRAVMTTSAGPAPEFCPPHVGYLIPATETRVPDPPPPFGDFSAEWTWFEPDLVALAQALRTIYDDRKEAARRGDLAGEMVLQTHAWPQILSEYFTRIADLTVSGPPAGQLAKED
jgi:glycosyltransferase involved in cell wall biosynthesis